MDAQTASAQFQKADSLFRQGQYGEALSILSQLNRDFPNQKNIMYAAALCMEKTGSIHEAKMLCQHMIRNFDSQKARELLNHLETAPRIAVQPAGIIEIPDEPGYAQRARPVMPQQKAAGGNAYIIIGIVAATLLAIILPFMMMPSKNVYETDFSGFLAVLLLSGITLQVVFSYVLKRICENADAEPGILIWIPILQIFPMLRAAQMSYFWLLMLFVPFIGGLVFSLVLWVKLCQACDKPAWIAILLLVPGLNIGVLLYLAFS